MTRAPPGRSSPTSCRSRSCTTCWPARSCCGSCCGSPGGPTGGSPTTATPWNPPVTARCSGSGSDPLRAMNTRSHFRLLVLHVLVASLLVSLGGRLWYLQVLNGDHYQRVAAENRTRDIVVPAVRGQILDDVGRPLVRNRTALVVSVDRTVLSRQADGGTALLKRLAKVLGTPQRKLEEKVRLCAPGIKRPCWPGSPYQPIPVDDRVSMRVALQIMERQEDFPGVTAQVQAVRQFPRPAGAGAAQALGYLQPITQEELDRRKGLKVTGFSGVDLIGRDGLEGRYDGDLRGAPGV